MEMYEVGDKIVIVKEYGTSLWSRLFPLGSIHIITDVTPEGYLTKDSVLPKFYKSVVIETHDCRLATKLDKVLS